MRRNRLQIYSLLIVGMLHGVLSEGFAQARQPLALTRVIYNTRKATVKPQGELKEKIDALDREITEAARMGKSGEMRRLMAKGLALLSGKEWDQNLEFSNSLILRTEAVCVDSSEPYTVRLEQVYAPRVELQVSLNARISIHKIERGEGNIRTGEKVKDLGLWEAVGRDFQDEPLRIETDLTDIPDGPYMLRVELFEKESPVGSVTMRVDLWRGLRQRLNQIAKEAQSIQGFEELRADVLYPQDFLRNVNRGRTALGSFDIAKELSRAETVLASLQAGKDPFRGRTGAMERHFFLESAGEIMPFRVYVPQAYSGDKAFPLVIALHGLGANQNSFLDSYGQQVPKLAEEHGYLIASPLGYRVDGGYGAGLFRSAGDSAAARKSENSEKDVMQVLDLMRKYYRVDEKRIYLMGHSMGAIGTWYLGAKYPEIWAALAPFSGIGNPAGVEKMKAIPQIVVHGDADPTVPVNGSRSMVEAMKRLGVEHQYIEVPGGDHINIVVPNLPAVFDFFNKHSK